MDLSALSALSAATLVRMRVRSPVAGMGRGPPCSEVHCRAIPIARAPEVLVRGASTSPYRSRSPCYGLHFRIRPSAAGVGGPGAGAEAPAPGSERHQRDHE